MRGRSQICRNEARVLICSGPARPCCLICCRADSSFFQTGPHGRQQFQALLGDLHAPAASAEQRHLDIRLQCLDLLADRGRGDVEGSSGVRETQMRRHRLEHAQGAQGQPVVGG